ncbi:MAG: hypothetical protein QME90_04195 [Thermodesulfobacteriota bacterium]|nr:hypothetical protein [Thermodesulfobacteriota bacterium]
MSEGRDENILTCGYGLIGLCCSDCLLGPCRISPFEKDSQRGVCKDNVDLMVFKNLLRAVTGEVLEGLRDLKEAAERLLPRDSHQGRRPQSSIKEQEGILKKYGCPPGKSKKIQNRYLFKEVEKLLSPFSQGKNMLLKNLFPEKAFTPLTQNSFPSGSLTSALLDTRRRDSTESPDIETMLQQCLQVSMIPLLCEELRQDINDLLSEEGSSRNDQKTSDAIRSLPMEASPVIFLLSDEKISSGEWVHRTAQSLQEAFKGKVPTFSVNGIGTLREMGKRLSERWSLPLTGMRIVALVSSPRATWVLGTLSLGFSVISHPALPIHGSERVEKFFSEGLKRKFGNTYFLSWREDHLHCLLEFLK